MILTFSILDRKYPFWENLVPKNQNVCLGWNLVCRLTFEFPDFDSNVLFSWFKLKMSFWGKFGIKNQNCLFMVRYGIWPNSNMLNSMSMLTLFSLRPDSPLWANLIQKLISRQFHSEVHFFLDWKLVLVLREFDP